MSGKIFYTIVLVSLFQFVTFANTSPNGKTSDTKSKKGETINFTVTVTDKDASIPLQSVIVVMKKNNSIIAKTSTNAFGRAQFNDLETGSYSLAAYYVGYNDFITNVDVDVQHKTFDVKLSEKNVEMNEVVVKGDKINKVATTIDVSNGQQVFEGATYHAAPTSQMSTLIQQNLAGAARAPTGEVHIRGQHGEFTYLVDGIPIPLGVFGGLNEIVDPKVITRVNFLTGGFPAEYGGQITGIMDIQNRVPTGKFHLDFSTYAGSYLTSNNDSLGSRVGTLKALNSNGQSLSFSDHIGKLGYFVSTSRQETDRRIDQPVRQLFHDHGFDYFLYSKLDYLLNENDYVTANLNFSSTQAQVPYNPLENFMADDQHTYNSFQTISFFHTISAVPDKESNLFIGAFARQGGLRFLPNLNDDNKVYLNNDTTQSYVVDQDRSFSTFGIRTKFDQSISHHFKYAVGFNYSGTAGREKFRFFNSLGDKQILSNNFSGYDFGVFAQSEWHPFEWTRLEFGLRYDLHNAPSIANQDQFSPRIKWNFFIDELNSISLSYSRLFMPTNIENLGAIASELGNNATPTYPEKDNLYEIAFMRNWENGFMTKIAGFIKDASPGLDDQTLGSSTIRVNVNINQVKVRGIELALTYNSSSIPFSGFLNASIIHAYGIGPITGGFIPQNLSTVPFDLDHDQRLSAVIGLNYQPEDWFVNLTGTYGSGLTNYNGNYIFKTGLFDLNQGAHTTPAFIFNVSAGYKFNLGGGQTLEPSIYITNIFDHQHLVKGAFFSGASYEEPRNLVFKISYHL